MVRLRYITEDALGARIDAAKAHVWKKLAELASEQHGCNVVNFTVTMNGNQPKIMPDDLVTVAEATQFVQELAQLMEDFSVFPYPPEA